MKKLMFALVAGVAATVATAAPITTSGFETAEGFAVGGSPTNVARFAYAASSSSEDGSTVKAYTAEGMEKKSVSYDNGEFAGVGDNYLDLSTDGGILYRSINEIDAGHSYGAPRAVTSKLYIDTLVQFTVCDSAPEIDNNAKLAIWLQASDDETTTNLMVKANHWTVSKNDGVLVGTCSPTGRVYTINSAPGKFKAGEWYRLTVEDLGNVFTAEGYGATGFRIKVDGDVVRSAYGSSFHTTINGEDGIATEVLRGLVKGVVEDYTQNAEIFMSLADTTLTAPQAGYVSQLSAVGFSGTGAVDNIMFTEENPYFTAPTAIDFTIALSNVGSVGYSFTTNAYTDVGSFTGNGGTLKGLPPGTAVTLTPTAKTDELGWNIYGTPVVENAVNADISGSVVTVKPTFTQAMGDTASVQVNASETPVTKDDAEFANAVWNTGDLTAETFARLVAWAGARGYSTSRVANYPYALERMQADLPIEVYVVLNPWAGVISSYNASATALTAEEKAELDDSGLYDDYNVYKVDAGTALTISNVVFTKPGQAHKSYALTINYESGTWNFSNGDPVVPMQGFAAESGVAVDTTEGTITYTTAYAPVQEGWAGTLCFAGVGYELADEASYTLTFISGEGATTNEISNLYAGDTFETPTAAEVVGKTFTGWDPAVVSPVAGDATYTAQYSVNTYAITFFYGESSSSDNVEYGVVPTAPTAAAEAAAPTGKHFTGWDKTIVAATEATTYTAQYAWNTYTIKFVYGLNGEYTNTVENVTHGDMPSLPDNPDPAYAVSGYDISWPTFVAATADAVYTATYTASAPETPTITPAAGGETEPYTGDDAADKAAAAATAVNAVLAGDNLAAKEAAVPAPSSVTTTEAKNAYYANIKAVATDSHTVTIDFSDAGKEVAQTNATIEVAAVAAKLGEVAASSEGGAANIATVPGFYYSILYKASLDASWTEQLPRVLGTGDSEPITVPKAGAAGFYQLKVSPVYKAAPTE